MPPSARKGGEMQICPSGWRAQPSRRGRHEVSFVRPKAGLPLKPRRAPLPFSFERHLAKRGIAGLEATSAAVQLR
ncbi:MAG: hypothetical protein ACTS4U_00715 [Candidatus Hodgkinia cicadicola]